MCPKKLGDLYYGSVFLYVFDIYKYSVKMRCRLCELFTDQLQAFSLNNLHSIPNQLHHYHQHMSAVASSTFLLPQLRDTIAACLLRGRNTSWWSNVCEHSHCMLYQHCIDRNRSCLGLGGGGENCLLQIFTYVPCILILPNFYLFTNWCTSELS